MIDEGHIFELLKVTEGGNLYHREGQELEFKEQFNLSGLAEYFRDFAAFANNRGGYLVFGITDSPRRLKGLSESSLNQFEKIDPQRISGYLLDIFSGHVEWNQAVFTKEGKTFGVFSISSASVKPIIAKKDEGKDQIIRNGEIYYRYGGRTQKIQYAELENIISKRIEQNNKNWIDLVEKIGKAGPNNAAILDTERSLIEKDDKRIMVLDENLAKKIKFIKEGQFEEKGGATTLKLVGDIVPINQIEVIKKVRENLLKEYPLSARDLISEVKRKVPNCKESSIYDVIRENGIKSDADYAAFNFRSKRHQDDFKHSGKVASGTPIIYNAKAVNLVVKLLQDKILKG